MRGSNLFRARRTLIAAAALSAAGVALAQSTLNEMSPPPMLDDLYPTARPLTEQARDLHNQALAMMGREDLVEREQTPTCTLADADPLDMIEAAARNTSIVIINEAQDTPQHRAFIADVAKRLIPLGYRTYAAETLFRPTESGPGVPKLRAGFYSAEPVFGMLLRELRSANVRLVAYDQLTPTTGDYVDDINAQEALQASNIINRVLLQNHDEKVLIHVTHAHNKEGAEGAGRGLLKSRQILWLAQRLKDILGIDPLTIDQTSYSAERFGACFTESGGAAPPTSRDLYIAYPRPTFDHNRPAWRLARGQVFAEPPRSLHRPGKRAIVEARLPEDADDTVPLDRILIEPGEDIPLLLAPGRYKTRAWIDGKWTADAPLVVTAPRKPAPSKSTRRKKS